MGLSWKRTKNKTKTVFTDLAASPRADDALTAVKRTLLVSLALAEVTASGIPIPGVAAAVVGVIKIVEAAQQTADNTSAVEELNADLALLMTAVTEPLKDEDPSKIPPELAAAVAVLVADLHTISAIWNAQASRKLWRRVLSSSDDSNKLAKLCQQIKDTVERFKISGDIRRERGIHRVERNQLHALLEGLPRAKSAGLQSGRIDAPKKCLDGTRTQLLALIKQWLLDTSSDSKPTFWLNGIAGVGKSTIAVTIAELALSLGLLGACFFFSRTAEAQLRNAQLVFPTLAYQMANHNPELRRLIIAALEADSDVASQSLNQQAEKLVIGPLKSLGVVNQPILFVLDALDECEGPAKEVLQLLLAAAAQVPATLKVFITSRPEHHIVSVFKKPGHVQNVVLHDIEESIVQSDIKRYLRVSLSDIPAELDIPLDPTWLKEDDLNQLTMKAGKLFIHAATSIRFIADDAVNDPPAQLSVILGHRKGSLSTNPYSDLDRLYVAVLRSMVSSSNEALVLERFQAVVGTIVLLRDPLALSTLGLFLDRSILDIRNALRLVQSVVINPEKDDQPPYTYHPSFTDFITEASRCRDSRFVVDRTVHETRLAGRCLELMITSLRRDIASLGSLSAMNQEVEDFASKVVSAFPPHLSYACRWWASHLSQANPKDNVLQCLLDRFASGSLLWWIEALSLLNLGPVGVECIQLARTWATSSGSTPRTVELLNDGQRFILANLDIIGCSAPQIYRSALPFTPYETAFYKTYQHELTKSVTVVQGLGSHWSPCLAICNGHVDWVKSVTFSADGMTLATGSDDQTVRLWDMGSGAPVMTHVLTGHTNCVNSLAFSPDGAVLASASHDTTVRRWNVASGAQIDILAGHTGWVRSVAFSPNGKLLASGSEDYTVRIWDVASGQTVHQLDDHVGGVSALAFAPNSKENILAVSFSEDIKLWDVVSGEEVRSIEGHRKWVSGIDFCPSPTVLGEGSFLASASVDKTIKLWNAESGDRIKTFKGHTDCVRTIAFNPEGTLLASASPDKTVRVWDLQSSSPLLRTLGGHSSCVNDVSFSPDGSILVSASHDHTIRIWDVASISDLSVTDAVAHTDWIRTVAFSPDGSTIVSASDDCTIRLWNAKTGAPIGVLKDHTGWVVCIAFSRQGESLASGSYDNTVRIWDIETMTATTCLEGHTDSIKSVAFSPVEDLLVSGSDDQSLILWDSKTQELITRMTGHTHDVSVVEFSRDGTIIASASPDRSIKLWDVKSRSLLTTVAHEGDVRSLAFSTDGVHLSVMTPTEMFHFAYALDPPDHESWQRVVHNGVALASHSPGSAKHVHLLMRDGCLCPIDGPAKDKRICWIPPAFHPEVAVSMGTKVVIGTRTGAFVLLDTSRRSMTMS